MRPSFVGFNTTLVQLKVIVSERLAQRLLLFQYHTGPIKRSTVELDPAIDTERFNTTLVQLKGIGGCTDPFAC